MRSEDCYMMRPQRTATRAPKIAVNSETNYFLFTKSNIVSVFRLDQRAGFEGRVDGANELGGKANAASRHWVTQVLSRNERYPNTFAYTINS